MDYEALSADELQPVGSDLEHSDGGDDGVRRDEVRSVDETRKTDPIREMSQEMLRFVENLFLANCLLNCVIQVFLPLTLKPVIWYTASLEMYMN